MTDDKGHGYADVNGLYLYYEILGTGDPVVLLYGAFMSMASMEGLATALARTRQVIAVDLQGHGRTADVDRPLSYGQTADDVAGLVRHLGVEQTDVFGYSMGGGSPGRDAAPRALAKAGRRLRFFYQRLRCLRRLGRPAERQARRPTRHHPRRSHRARRLVGLDAFHGVRRSCGGGCGHVKCRGDVMSRSIMLSGTGRTFASKPARRRIGGYSLSRLDVVGSSVAGRGTFSSGMVYGARSASGR